jgi:hypothetical protein
MRKFLRWSLLGLFLASLAGGIIVAINFEKLLDRYAPFDLREEPNWLTNAQLYYLRASPEKCFAVLSRSEVQFARQQFPMNARGCGYEDGVLLTKQSVGYGGGVLLRCSAAASLVLWERHVLQQEAQRVLKKKVRAIQTFGTFSCRNVNNRKEGRLSQHATANAIDIAGFTRRRMQVFRRRAVAGLQRGARQPFSFRYGLVEDLQVISPHGEEHREAMRLEP